MEKEGNVLVGMQRTERRFARGGDGVLRTTVGDVCWLVLMNLLIFECVLQEMVPQAFQPRRVCRHRRRSCLLGRMEEKLGEDDRLRLRRCLPPVPGASGAPRQRPVWRAGQRLSDHHRRCHVRQVPRRAHRGVQHIPRSEAPLQPAALGVQGTSANHGRLRFRQHRI